MTQGQAHLEASMASRFLPLASILILLSIACIFRPALQYWRYGTLGFVIFSRHRFDRNLREALLVLLFLALVAQGIVAALRVAPMPKLLVYTGPVHDVLQVAGVMLIVGGLIVFMTAELQMGASWRIGIEDGAKPGLVTHGLYRCSRNPIYLGLLATLFGYTALLPTPLSVVLLTLTCVGIRMRVAREEAYLLATYADEFRDYVRRVGRFVPRPSALRHRKKTTASDAQAP